MTANRAPDFGSYLQRYRSQIIWASIVVIGLVLPRLGELLQKSGEGYEFHNLAVGLALMVTWFLLTIGVVILGTPLPWALTIGVAPAVPSTISGLLHTASNYADPGHNFWLLILTGDGQAIRALLLDGSLIFLVGIPAALIAYVIGRTALQRLDGSQDEDLSRLQSLLLIALAFLSVYIARFIERGISSSVLYP